jgi:hypothetical protein
MAKGLDASVSCLTEVNCLKNAGYQFIARYYNIGNPAKNLTLQEAQAISQAGMQIVVVWENGAPTNVGYFSYMRGVHDGTLAYHIAMHDIGQPAGTPIYFAVDFDAVLSQIVGVISSYFQGIQAGFNTISADNPVYPIGAYGSGLVCNWLLTHQLAKYTWLSGSTGWQGYSSFTAWNIKQGATTTACNLSIDPDQSTDNYGGFQVATS